MAYSRNQLVARIQQSLSDSSGVYFNSPEVVLSLQDALDEINIAGEIFTKEASVVVPPNTLYYNIYEAIPDYYRLVSVFSPARNMFLPIKNFRNFATYRRNWEKSYGTPYEIGLVNYQYITFYPTTPPTQPLTFRYVAFPAPVGDTDLISYPAQFISCVELYCIADLLEQLQEFTKAGIAWQDYETRLGQFSLMNIDSVAGIRLRGEFNG